MKIKKDYVPIVFVIVLILLLFDAISSIYEYYDYEKRKDSGNERWKQVELRIQELEKRIDEVK